MKPLGIAFCALAGVAFVALGFQFSVLRVSSSSMQPTLCTNDVVMVRRLIADPSDLGLRGRVVIARHGSGEPIVKRAIALPGDKVQWTDSSVAVNYQTLREPYACTSGRSVADLHLSAKEITLNSGQLYVLGDNRNVSQDSRTYGAISISDVIGVVIGSFHIPLSGTCQCAS